MARTDTRRFDRLMVLNNRVEEEAKKRLCNIGWTKEARDASIRVRQLKAQQREAAGLDSSGMRSTTQGGDSGGQMGSFGYEAAPTHLPKTQVIVKDGKHFVWGKDGKLERVYPVLPGATYPEPGVSSAGRQPPGPVAGIPARPGDTVMKDGKPYVMGTDHILRDADGVPYGGGKTVAPATEAGAVNPGGTGASGTAGTGASGTVGTGVAGTGGTVKPPDKIRRSLGPRPDMFDTTAGHASRKRVGVRGKGGLAYDPFPGPPVRVS